MNIHEPKTSRRKCRIVYKGLSPYDALETRIRKAMDEAVVARRSDGLYRASTPRLDPVYAVGTTRKEALSELWEECRWLLSDPVRISISACGRSFVAEFLAERRGGYSVSVPSLPGCYTCGQTMDEARAMTSEAIEGYLANESARALVKA